MTQVENYLVDACHLFATVNNSPPQHPTNLILVPCTESPPTVPLLTAWFPAERREYPWTMGSILIGRVQGYSERFLRDC